MLVEAKVDYVAGGWPGERYTGTTAVAVNVENDADESEIDEKLRDRAKDLVAKNYVMSRGSVTVTDVRIVTRIAL